MPRDAAVSLADFAAAGVRLRPTDAVTIVRTLVMQVAERSLPGVPSAHVIRLSLSGDVSVEGPVVASGQPVPRAAQLLAALLPGGKPQSAEPTPLWRLIDRAVQSPPAYGTLEAFAAALAPFAAHDPQAAIQELTARWAGTAQSSDSAAIDLEEENQGPTDDPGRVMGVSEMRRARRDTGLSLDEVSKRSRIPVSLLRQLEWGYLRNWPQGLYGRTQLVRYARAAGLDRQRVLDAIWPLVASQAANPGAVLPSCAVADAGSIPILIDQPAFGPDEVLFETEGGHPAEVTAETREEDPADQLAPPAGLLDPTPQVEAPRRVSMAAAAALLALASAGALWGLRESPTDCRGSTPQVIRRVPATANRPATPSAELSPSRLRPLPPVLRSGVGSVSRALSTTGVRPATDAQPIAMATGGHVVPVDASEDDASIWSAAFQSAGGVEFADPIQPPSGGSGNGLGLRIMRIVDERSRSYHTRPSPDGTRVAFDSDRDGDRAVFVADASGRNLRRVSGAGFAAMPNWSPDGRALSYVRAEVDNPNVWNLWALDLDSGESRRLTSNASGRPQGGSWFPDGQHIAYSFGSGIAVLDVASGKPAVYPSPQAGRAAGAPAVSPDGRWVIFQLSGDGAWLLDLTDGAARKVLSDPTAGDFTWSPDGSRVAYYSRRDSEWSVWVTVAR